MPLTLFGDPAPPPLIEGPVALMRLIEIDEISELEDTMRRMRLGQGDFIAETKFNGWLTQVAGGRIYSRRGEDLTGKFPEISDMMSRYTSEHLLGELVYWKEDGLMELPTVTSIAMTKSDREAVAKLRALPGFFSLVLFDVIAAQGYDLSKRSTAERIDILRNTVDTGGPILISQPSVFEDWKKVYDAGVALGGDGVVLKNLHAPYVWRQLGEPEPRPVGFWYKLKPVYTDDFVVFGSLRGPKGKLLARIGQYHRGQLVEVGQINNFAKDVEAEILERLSRGAFVMEVEYQGRFSDPPGALQHGRFYAFRDDKPMESVILPERYA